MNLLKDLTLTTAVIVYLFLCGGFYIYSFWSSFNINPSNFISITDIPKNFIYPLVKNQWAALLGLFLGLVFMNNRNRKAEKQNDKEKAAGESTQPTGIDVPEKKAKSKGGFVIDGLLIVVAIALIGWMIYLEQWTVIRLFGLISLLGFILSQILPLVLDKIVPRTITAITAIFYLGYILIFCFKTGDEESEAILKNKEVKIVKFYPCSDTIACRDTTKLVGFLGDKIVVSTLNNEKIFVINQSSYERLELTEFTELEKKLTLTVKPKTLTRDTLRH